ncbi:hypothetical protein [Vogesella urethralis]|uniref:hypothetical protein n=1 Tax=Vogesella urethralis TaxID=2592656 RepID=UPI0014784175|nr:hypothetical protein [Vogesella urethralis]
MKHIEVRVRLPSGSIMRIYLDPTGLTPSQLTQEALLPFALYLQQATAPTTPPQQR